MAKRDEAKTLRNKQIAELTARIDAIKPKVMAVTGFENEHSLNATYGGKHAEYIDIKHEVIDTPEQFISLYLQGFLGCLESLGSNAKTGNAYYNAFLNIKNHPIVLQWLKLFLARTYLRQYEALSKVRPDVEQAEIWIGQENASYGIFVTPRFIKGQWQNDKSEIRHFKPHYWTIGHILQTGLVIPDKEEVMTFENVEAYLKFFKNVLVRNSGSKHEREIAERYCAFVIASDEPEKVPLLIPELRYGGKEAKHEYRLDFTVIDPYTMRKVGFELSPWSTHGHLKGTKGKTQKEINAEAQANFEKEMRKLKSFFRKLGITILVYTDADLQNHDVIFENIKKYLTPTKEQKQLVFQAVEDFLAFKPI